MSKKVIDQLNCQIRKCDKCVKGDSREAGYLAEARKRGEFQYDWKSWWWPPDDPGGPCDLILYTWEPSMSAVHYRKDKEGYDPLIGPPMDSNLDDSLNFAAQTFLGSRRYLIVNLGLCSIKVDDADWTREWRYSNCAEHLKSHLEIACNRGQMPLTVSVGTKPQRYLRSHYWKLQVKTPRSYIWHYGGSRNPRLFEDYAAENRDAFDSFRATVEVNYKVWLKQYSFIKERRRLDLREDWNLTPELRRLFKWQSQMQGIKRSAG